jgi:hypothetical protein
MFTDLDAPNKMDEKPFFEFDLSDMKENQIEILKNLFHKSYFDQENIVNTASELKYTNEIMALIRNEIDNPSEWFVRGIAKIVYDGVVTAKVFEQFAALTKKSLTQVISDIITDRLKNALQKEAEVVSPVDDKPPVGSEEEDERIVTTEEELEGFYAVKAALRGRVDLQRIVYRDTISYFGILLDDNNRKPVCRLHFNGPKKFIEVFDENKKGSRTELASMDDIFKFADAMVRTIESYDHPQSKRSEGEQASESSLPGV